jgi:thymidylate synthase ThyX
VVSHAAKILADSLSPDGVPLTTFEVTMPRIVLAEFNTHRMFSRNSASSRAIPVKKMIEMVMENPYIPSSWGKNQKGMQADEVLDAKEQEKAEQVWLWARDAAVERAQQLRNIGTHKQLTNRLLEPFMWHTVIVTATEWDNFFHLRNNAQAHPDIQIIAKMMQELYEQREPRKLDYGQWHLPLIDPDTDVAVCRTMRAGRTLEECREALCKISIARCARVSYLTHDGKRDLQADLDLHDRLLESGHLSPFEHVARPMTEADVRDLDGIAVSRTTTHQEIDTPQVQYTGPVRTWHRWSGNFRGWVQYRKLIPNEADILGARK